MTDTKHLIEFYTSEGHLEVRDCGEDIGFSFDHDSNVHDDSAEPVVIMIPKYKFEWIMNVYNQKKLDHILARRAKEQSQ